MVFNIGGNKIQHHWVAVQPLFSIYNEEEYDIAIERLNNLIDEVGTNEQHCCWSPKLQLWTCCWSPKL